MKSPNDSFLRKCPRP